MEPKILAQKLRGLVAGYFAATALQGFTPAIAYLLFVNYPIVDWWTLGGTIVIFVVAVLVFFSFRLSVVIAIVFTIILEFFSFLGSQHTINQNLSYTSYHKFILFEQAAVNVLVIFALLKIRREERIGLQHDITPPGTGVASQT